MKKLVSAFLASSMLFFYVPTLGAAETGNIIHEKLTCIPEDGQAIVYAKVTPLTSFTSFQALFHSKNFPDDYFVDLVRGPDDRFFAIFPRVDRNITKEVTYRIVGKNPNGTVFSTEQANVRVLSNSNCPVPLSKREQNSRDHLIVGHTTKEQPFTPPEGWLCNNIDYEITFDGQKRVAEDCRKLMAALPLGAAGAAGAAGAGTAGAAAGISTAVLVGAGAAALVAGGLIINNNSGGGGQPVVSSALPGGAQAQPPK